MKTESVEIDRRKRGVVWAEGISPVNIFLIPEPVLFLFICFMQVVLSQKF